MHLTLLNTYGESPFPKSVKLTQKWISIKGMLLGLSAEQVEEHQSLVQKETEVTFNFAYSEPRRTGRHFKAWSDLRGKEMKERKFDAAIHYFAEQTGGSDESFGLAHKLVEELDKEDKKPKGESVFRWSKVWKKPEGLITDLDQAIQSVNSARENEDVKGYIATQLKPKVKRKKRSESKFVFDDAIFADIKRVVLCTMAKTSRWTRAGLMKTISEDIGVPLSGDYLNQVQQFVDQIVTFYQREQSAIDQ